jgi:hypothetical protein
MSDFWYNLKRAIKPTETQKAYNKYKRERAKVELEDKVWSALKITTCSEVKPGDIIGVERGIYQHYGIYIGDNEVIHFSNFEWESRSELAVIRTDMGHFLDNAKKFFTVSIYRINNDIEKYSKSKDPSKISSSARLFEITERFNDGKTYNIYSPEEVVERAKSQLGKGNYKLLFNNCEHFAMWCKTGEEECNQFTNKLYREYRDVIS